MDLIEPKELVVKTQSGADKTYIISKVPYMSGGREICTQFITTAAPKMGNYQMNEALSLKMFSFIAVKTDLGTIRLSSAELVDNHVPDFQTGIRLEKKMLEYNFGFFDLEKVQRSAGMWAEKLQAFLTPILTQFVQQLSKKDAPHSMN